MFILGLQPECKRISGSILSPGFNGLLSEGQLRGCRQHREESTTSDCLSTAAPAVRVLAALAWCIQRARQASFLPPYLKIIWVCVCRRASEAAPLGGSTKVP